MIIRVGLVLLGRDTKEGRISLSLRVCMCVCLHTRGLRRQTWADGPQRCSHTESGHCDWCIATSKKVEHLAADPQSELLGPASSSFSRFQRADGGFGQDKHTFSTFPPWRKACAEPQTSPSSRQGGQDGGAGWEDECREPWKGAEAAHGVAVTLGWRGSDPRVCSEGPLLVEQLHMPQFLQLMWNTCVLCLLAMCGSKSHKKYETRSTCKIWLSFFHLRSIFFKSCLRMKQNQF